MDGILLIIAGGFEIASAIGLEYTDGFTRAVPTVVTATAMVASFFFLAQALRRSRSAPATRYGPVSAD